MMDTNVKLEQFIDEFAEALREQIREDDKRWGNTWRYRKVDGQQGRMIDRFIDYEDQSIHGNRPFPWTKIAGEALIGWVREQYPDYYLGDE
jgi:hypothetical protein